MKGSSIKSVHTFDDATVDKILQTEYQLSPWTLRRLAPPPPSLGFMNENLKKSFDCESEKRD